MELEIKTKKIYNACKLKKKKKTKPQNQADFLKFVNLSVQQH